MVTYRAEAFAESCLVSFVLFLISSAYERLDLYLSIIGIRMFAQSYLKFYLTSEPLNRCG
jgi:hypothetical protein